MATTVIKKAVFPVAGLGTRFLPATKANPKEMLPIVDKPLIQYAVEEAIAAGITELVFVTSNSKRAIEDHFDSNYELETKLETKQKLELLKTVRDILPRGVVASYVRQPETLGLGHAVLCAKHIVGNEPFAVLLADDLIDAGGTHCMQSMVEQFHTVNASVIAVQKIAPEQSSKYGIIDVEPNWKTTKAIKGIVEKPHPDDAPSNYAAVGRYILTPKIFDLLATLDLGSGGEVQLTDAISKLLAYEQVFAHAFTGVRYDCGSKLGYLKATIAYGLKHAEVGEDFQSYLAELAHSLA